MITGFLGAGKTTFLKNFIGELSGARLHLIINEFGKEGVDGTILKEMGAVLDEINNGSIFCSCRLDKFEEVLQRTLDETPDIIIVEASGLSNPMNVNKILNQKEKFGNVEYMGSICLVDARQFLKVYETAVVVKKQLSVSDMILINKADLVSEEQIAKVKEQIICHRPDVSIFTTTFGKIEKEWLNALNHSGKEMEEPKFQSEDITLRKYLIQMNPCPDLEDLQKFTEMFLDDTYRVKGFVEVKGELYLVDCVSSSFHAERFEGKPDHVNELVVLSGNGLPAGKSIKRAAQWYPQLLVEVKNKQKMVK